MEVGARRFCSYHIGLVIDGPVWGLLPPSGEFEVDLYGGARSWYRARLGLLYRLKIKNVVNEATPSLPLLFFGAGGAHWLAAHTQPRNEKAFFFFL